MKSLLLIPLLLLCSCVAYQHEATSKSGNHEKDTYVSLGGSASVHGADGSSLVHDHNDSFARGSQVVDHAIIAKIEAVSSENINSNNNAADVTKAKNASDAAAAQAKITADAQAASDANKLKEEALAAGFKPKLK